MPKAKKIEDVYSAEKSVKMNPNETKGTDSEDSPREQTCPNCGMSNENWSANEKQGFAHDGELYCCEGCALGEDCTCNE